MQVYKSKKEGTLTPISYELSLPKGNYDIYSVSSTRKNSNQARCRVSGTLEEKGFGTFSEQVQKLKRKAEGSLNSVCYNESRYLLL